MPGLVREDACSVSMAVLTIIAGIHWASTIPAFLAVLCLPFPFLFYRYGNAVRKRSKFAKEAAEFARGLREKPTSANTLIVAVKVEA